VENVKKEIKFAKQKKTAKDVEVEKEAEEIAREEEAMDEEYEAPPEEGPKRKSTRRKKHIDYDKLDKEGKGDD
jgi:hypothetical protein